MIRIASMILLGAFLAGCTSSPAHTGEEFSVRYARVVEVNRVTKPSAVPAGVILGGMTGLFLARNSASTGKRVAATAGGAAVGGIMADAMSDKLAYEYTLEYKNGESTRFVTEKGFIRKGDCVSVERGRHANLRRVAGNLCASVVPTQQATTVSDSAKQCHAAKEQLLLATTDDEVTQATRKVRILCQFDQSG